MILPIGQTLPDHLLKSLRELAADVTQFIDGASTAGWHARTLKRNLQAKPSPLVSRLLRQTGDALLANELVQAAARPKAIVRLLLSRYEPGMEYGLHVDDAIIDGQRTDLSFTLFLSAADSYDGGELVIDESSAERSFKLDAGGLLLYPSTTLHRVSPVTRGQRLVIVGWIRSLVRDPAQREILFDLERSITQLRQQADQQATLALLLKSRSNLLRMWSED
ncbi:MAG: Fe2+-dependent dioxygenase [Pseudomonadota bacterium]|nr:Fe2+-dependent dioxygenase [Pseudomonadota bacterium]